MIWCLNTNNTKRLLPRMRVNLTKRRRKKWPKKLGQKKKPKIETKKKSFCKSPARNFFEPFHFQQEHTITKKNCTVFFLATGIMILKHKRSTPPCLLFFLFCDNALLCKAFKYY